MKKTLISTFVLLVVFHLVSYFMLPDEVAIHFGKGGNANSWASKEVDSILFLVLETVLFLSFFYSPVLLKKTPAKWLNLPNKDYWLKEENKEAAATIFSNLMYEFGTCMLWFFFAMHILTIEANLSKPVRLNEKLFLIFLGVFLVYTVYWTVKIMRAFKIPSDQPHN